MLRRRFLLAVASTAVIAPFAGLAGCSNSVSSDEPQPVPPEDVVLSLPTDMYLHPGAPTEWWWHTGTLRAGDRTFGFEINAASFAKDGFGFSQILLTDVAANRSYKRTTPFVPPIMFDSNHWAQADVAKDWSVRMGAAGNQLSAIAVLTPGSGYTSPPTVKIVGGGGSGATARAFHTYVAMDAPVGDPTKNMTIRALLCDDPSYSEVTFDLTLSQDGRPFFVWGTGVIPGGEGGDVTKNNYYFSLTRLQASGSIGIDGETFDVSGVTWMDHQYGVFGTAANPVKWILQDLQLDNGVCISNYLTTDQGVPKLNEQVPSQATVQEPSGATYFVPTFLTPIGRTWTSPESGNTYFLQFLVEIPAFAASLTVTSLVDSQEFPVNNASVYEGVAEAIGTFRHKSVTGTAWNEQEV
jgi:predicted secreted hydrolase